MINALIRDPTETDLPDQRPMGDRHAWSETHRAIGDLHDWSETHRRPTCPTRDLTIWITKQKVFKNKYIQIYVFTFWYDSACISISGGSPLHRHVGTSVSNLTCRFPIRHVSLRSDMLISDQTCLSLIKNVGHRWVFDKACRSAIRYGSLRLVSDQACWSPIFLR